MNGITIGIIGIVLLVVLLFAGMNIGLVMTVVGFVGFGLAVNWTAAFGLLKSIPYNATANFSYSVIPLFVLMGQFAFHSGLSEDLYKACYKWFGRLPGGLSVATIGACAGFSAICGSSTATAATMGTVCLPEMRRYGYGDGLSTGSLAAGGTLGILIPPSVGFILYGITAEESIGVLFAAGLVPGIMLALFYMATAIFLSVRKPEIGPKGEKFTFKEKLIALKDVLGMLVLFIIVIGGILGGLFTANEGAAIGAVGAFLFMLLRRRFTWKRFLTALKDTLQTASMILLIIVGATVFGSFLTVTGLPSLLATTVAGMNVSPYIVLIIILLVYMALGCIMDSLAMILLLVPIFLPVIKGVGMDPIWFGVLMVMVMETGLITPPVGMNVFIISGISKDISMSTVFKGVMPFLLALVLAVAVIMIFPPIATFLPNLLY